MEMKITEFTGEYLNKPRCKKVVDLIDLLVSCNYEHEFESVSNTLGVAKFYINTPIGYKSILRMDITIYKSSWVVKVTDSQHDIYEKAVGTTKINELVDKLEKAFNEVVEPDIKTDNNIIIDNLFKEIVDNYQRLSTSFRNVCDVTKRLFLETIDDLKHIPENISLSNDTMLDILKIYKYIDWRFKGNLFEEIVLLSTVANKFLNYIGSVCSDNVKVKDEVRITAESNPICYAHILPFYGGKCHRLHGHNGKLSITMVTSKDFCRKRPMIVSYGFLKGFLKYIDNIMDHTTLIHINKKNVSINTFEEHPGYSVEIHLDTDNLNLSMTDGYNLIPNIENVPDISNETTSEMTLVNFVIPLFKMYLVDFILKEGIDNTDQTMFGLEEPIKFEFTWGETDSTYCTVAFSI